MALTRSPHKALVITQWFSNEIITEIVQAASKKDQATLCRVSTLFYGLALPILNRDVVLSLFYETTNIVRAFCSALIANPTRAEAIRSFKFVDLGWKQVFPSFPCSLINNLIILLDSSPELFDVLFASTRLMNGLQHLTISSNSSGLASRISLLTFPQLRSCRLKLGPDTGEDVVASFLTRHSTLTYVHVDCPLSRGLQHLTISSNSSGLASRISLLTFPQLRSCRLKLGPDTGEDVVASFLTRHSTLTYVHVDCPLSRISLPNLRYFEGHAASVPLLAAHGLTAARLMWHTHNETQHTDTIFAALNSLIHPALPFVSAHKFAVIEYPTVLASLSRQMPLTKSLGMHFAFGLAKDTEETTTVLMQCLAQFGHLVYLAVDYTFPGISGHPWTVDRQCAALQAWANVCPTLDACFLFGRAWRKLDGAWQEYPVEDFLSRSGLSAFAEI
ncbi:hypothetical protein DFH07DRAFT_970920 [Mycena maculata]|uniref:Uncharacterized protein n=1 Tax=Mycena maculata TaxID=230809 RepID=A0AAD7MNL3_9AGAR|nr:hypothetical protein DFH07DRAFT_970920 [Mycena maculata]